MMELNISRNNNLKKVSTTDDRDQDGIGKKALNIITYSKDIDAFNGL